MTPLRLLLATAIASLVLGTAADGARADEALDRGRKALAVGNYALAEKELAEAVKGKERAQALVLTARLELWTGRYDEAVKTAREAAKLGPEPRLAAAPFLADALVRSGKTDEAITELQKLASEPDAHRVHVMLGELLIRTGKRSDGEQELNKLVQAYNSDVITASDAEGMTLVARAADLLRAPRDANDAFDEAERAGGKKRSETLLWRAELFLDKYDPGHAAEVTKEALALAPGDPRALVMMAHVKLEQTMDFAAAEALIDQALKVDPQLGEAYFVRAGLALRVMDLEAAAQAVDKGLARDPRNLELLSMKAATRLLAEDPAGFAALEQQVLALSPAYSRFYLIVGEFAEWEHRYDEIVAMMRKAVQVDPLDAKAYAALGLNLIRNGEEVAALDELRKAWKRDKYNVRVYNTLNLYEEVIPKEYVTVDGTRFRIRYPKREMAVLERYLPRMLEQAWTSLSKRYGFTPAEPMGLEIYADPEHFSIRTSGLPAVGIQGVCFGKTLAALSPSAGPFNWGMIVWHELSHVFHIQRSHNRVPRWFTEGLAEYETIIARPEWRREEEQALYFGLRDGKIPKVASFNRAFTHADSPQDVTMAYYAASQIAVFMAEEFGFDKVAAHLPAWAAGKPTPQVVAEVLGIGVDELDARFRKWLAPRLARYDKQFVPDLRPPKSLAEAQKALADDPQSASKHVRLALALLGEGKKDEALATLELALQLDPKEPTALFMKLRLHLAKKETTKAKAIVQALIKGGHDGYAVRMKAADIAELDDAKDEMKQQLFEAHRFDPSQAEPLQALYDLAHKQQIEDDELFALRKLALVDQHDRRVCLRLLRLLVKRGEWDEAVRIGESAMFVDVLTPETHQLYARALARTGRQISAIFELNSAIKAGPDPKRAAKIYRLMAEGYRKLGKAEHATKAEAYAKDVESLPGPAATPPQEDE